MCAFLKSKAKFLVAAAALSALVIGAAVAGTSFAQNAPKSGEAAFTLACARADLELFTAIEKFENTELYASPSLINAATSLQNARIACAGGDVTSGLTIYNSAIRELHATYAELEAGKKILRAERIDR